METIKDLENNSRWEEDILHERMKKGTITTDDKKSKRCHIAKLQNDVKLENTLLDKISRNWSNQINNIKKNGPSNKPRGRKPRTTFSKIDFKTAKDLKKIWVSIDQEEAETNTIATEGNTETDTFIIDTETDTCTVVSMDIEPSTEIEMNVDIETEFTTEIETNVVDKVDTNERNQPAEKDIIKSSNGVDAYKESFQTEDGLSVILPGFCQNTVLNQNSDLGSSACVGICLLIMKSILKEHSGRCDQTEVVEIFKEAVTLGYQYWIKNHLTTMDVKTALRLPIFQDLNTTVAIDVDILWHNTLRIGAYDSGSDAVLETFSKMKNRGLAGAFLFTVFPDKSFIVFFNEDFNLTLLDSHIHFTAPPEQLSFEAALKRKDCQGMIICATKAQYRDLVKYIFRTVIKEIRAQDNHGNIIVLLAKN